MKRGTDSMISFFSSTTYHVAVFWSILFVLVPYNIASSQEEEISPIVEEEAEPSYAILFPWFTELIGIFVFFLLTRYCKVLPYTAVMFLLGTFMGIGATRLHLNDHLHESIRIWAKINGEVLLLVFIPGLVFRDAYTLNVHLFQISLTQCLILAFPMVLAGTALTALVGYYVFPFGWSFNLAMTFGSILSATDPVAVSSLLDEVGAPPRLKMLISGESLLNDGSAMVFYNIFSKMFLYELGVPGLGGTVSVGEGFALFFRMSLGGAAIGFVFSLALILVLYWLNRRLNQEENAVNVVATITFAYLTYYVADVICGTSGIISVVTLGVMTRAFGYNMVNDQEMTENFWAMAEHMLNTLLFALGGVVWGSVISNRNERFGLFVGKDWGYLVLLYVLVNAIRFVCLFSFYPIISRIGLKTNLKEATFMCYGGLRGAIGISLAIALDNEVWSSTENVEFRRMSNQLFGMVGGIAFMTLIINAPTSGPLLTKLGLTEPTKMRKMIVESFKKVAFKQRALDDFVRLLSEPVFAEVDFAFVKKNVPFFRDMTEEELQSAVDRHKELHQRGEYREPSLKSVKLHLSQDSVKNDDEELGTDPKEHVSLAKRLAYAEEKEEAIQNDANTESSELTETTMEIRRTFINLLRYAYQEEVEKGELDGRWGLVSYALLESLEFASDAADKGEPLNDWEASRLVSRPWRYPINSFVSRLNSIKCCAKHCGGEVVTVHQREILHDVLSAWAFIEAHNTAEKLLKERFDFKEDDECFVAAEEVVIKESRAQVRLAMECIESYDQVEVEHIISLLFCNTLMRRTALYIEKLCNQGVLKEQEAETFLAGIQEVVEVYAKEK